MAQAGMKVNREGADKDQAGQQFNNKVTRRNTRLAMPAFASQKQPGDKRYVVVKLNVFAAGWTG